LNIIYVFVSVFNTVCLVYLCTCVYEINWRDVADDQSWIWACSSCLAEQGPHIKETPQASSTAFSGLWGPLYGVL